MALDRAAVESQLLRRCGRRMAVVGMDATTQDGTNADLNDPIRRAVQALGLVTVDPITVADVDLAGIGGFDIERLLDYGELRTLESVIGNSVLVSEKVGDGTKQLQQFVDQVQKRIAQLEATLSKPYGPTMPSAAAGQMNAGKVMPNDPFVFPCGYNPVRWPY